MSGIAAAFESRDRPNDLHDPFVNSGRLYGYQ